MSKGIWFSSWLLLGLMACGGSDKKTENTDLNFQPNTSAFQLRVNVQGLNGPLTLANNEINPVTIHENGMTTMPASWSLGSSYEIRVKEEPCTQRCVVDEPTGPIETIGSKTLTVTCSLKTWEFPLSASESMSVAGTNAETPSLAMNRYGDLALTWYQNDFFNLQLYKKLYKNRTWQSPTSITDHFSFAGSDAYNQSVDINDNGEVSIAWSQSSGDMPLYLGSFDGSEWEFPLNSNQNINVAGGPVSDRPHVIKTNNLGEKIVVWSQVVSGNDRVYKAEYRNGQWNMPSNLVDNINPDGTDVSWMDAAIDDLGNIIIVWQQSDGNYESVFKSEYRNGVWTHPSTLGNDITMPGTDAYEPRVAMNNLGDAFIVWHQMDNDDYYQLNVAEFHNGVWTIPTNLSDNISPDNRHAKYPRVVTNDAGMAQIAYMYRPDNNVNVYQMATKGKLPGGDWSGTQYLATSDATSNPSRSSIGMDDQGNVLIAWSLTGNGNVYKAEYRYGNWILASLSNPVNFNSAMNDLPQVVVNNCRSAIAWQQNNDAGVNQIYIAQYR